MWFFCDSISRLRHSLRPEGCLFLSKFRFPVRTVIGLATPCGLLAPRALRPIPSPALPWRPSAPMALRPTPLDAPCVVRDPNDARPTPVVELGPPNAPRPIPPVTPCGFSDPIAPRPTPLDPVPCNEAIPARLIPAVEPAVIVLVFRAPTTPSPTLESLDAPMGSFVGGLMLAWFVDVELEETRTVFDVELALVGGVTVEKLIGIVLGRADIELDV